MSPENLEKQIRMLQKKLKRSEEHRVELEHIRDRHLVLQRTILNEVEEARRVIQQKNEELQRLNHEVSEEKERAEQLLLNILPTRVAEELKERGKVSPVSYRTASVLFTDFAGFTSQAHRRSPIELVDALDYYFRHFDDIIEKHGLEKLKTIGDSYMCTGGVPVSTSTHAVDTVRAALEIRDFVDRENRFRRHHDLFCWDVRIGVNSGSVLAGVIGRKKFAYDIWGDAVNIASRMESCGAVGMVNISQTTYDLVCDEFECEYRGRMEVKGKGEMEMYFVLGPRTDRPTSFAGSEGDVDVDDEARGEVSQ